MKTPIRRNVSCCFWLTWITLAILPFAHGQGLSRTANTQLIETLSANLRPTSASEIQLAKAQTEEALNRLKTELSNQAIGVILSQDLQLDWLASELRKEMPDAQILRLIERSLRRLLPGKVQRTVDEVRQRVSNLARTLSLLPAGMEIARQSLDTIRDHFQDEQLRRTQIGEYELRNAFAELAARHPSDSDIAMLRRALATANYSSLVKKDFLMTLSQRSFELPVHFRECKDGTSIAGDGKFRVALSLDLPPSVGESQLSICATGTGQIGVAVDRNRIHVCAQLSPQIQGQQLLHIRPSKIDGDSPVVRAHLSTQLTQVKIDGLLGRLRLTEKVASRAIQSKLDENERSVSAKIEKSVQERVEEEGFDLAYRINGLIQHGIWDRIQSLDYKPEVLMQNDSQGIHTDTHWVGKNQLGALSKRPEIASDRYQQLDLITWVHESAVNNIFDSFSGIRMDEATVRGLWETEFKLTSEDWRNLPPARIPAVITLADQSPVKLRFVSRGIEIRLRASSCELDGQIKDNVAREIVVRYLVTNVASGAEFTRQPLILPDGLPEDKVAMWTNAIDLFFGKTIRPMPKFRNASFSAFLRLAYLSLDNGWLVVGAARSPVSTAPNSTSSEEVSR